MAFRLLQLTVNCLYMLMDLLLYVTYPHISIHSLLHELHRFGAFSNFKLNISKTEALNISLYNHVLSTPQNNFLFHWQTTSVKYLGTEIPHCLQDL